MLQCIVVTPEQTFFDQKADFVSLTLFDGEIGVAPGHTPLIGRLGCGEMRIRHGGQTDRLYVERGFVEVLDDVVTVLTPRAAAAADLDPAVVEEQLHTAQARAAKSPELAALRDRVVEESRAQLRVAQRAGR